MAPAYEPCGALTLKGEPCKIARMSCTVHRRRQPAPRWPLTRAPGSHPGEERAPAAKESLPIPPAVTEHDLRGFAWWLVSRLLSGELDTQRAGVLATLLRVLSALGPEPASRERAFAEAALRGRMMHGLPPRDAAQWELAESLFSQEVLDEYAGYARMLAEATGEDTGRPFPFGERLEPAVLEPLDPGR
jgi:hypothetical protein